jgi:hypothetical protein
VFSYFVQLAAAVDAGAGGGGRRRQRLAEAAPGVAGGGLPPAEVGEHFTERKRRRSEKFRSDSPRKIKNLARFCEIAAAPSAAPFHKF